MLDGLTVQQCRVSTEGVGDDREGYGVAVEDLAASEEERRAPEVGAAVARVRSPEGDVWRRRGVLACRFDRGLGQPFFRVRD